MAQVLVVEDDETIGRTLTSSLGVHGHTARWVMTGAAALSAAEQQPFDLALLDLGLPDMDGVDVCRRLRAAQPGWRVGGVDRPGRGDRCGGRVGGGGPMTT